MFQIWKLRLFIKNIERKLGQISRAVSKLEVNESNRLPLQTEPNPRPNVSAITLRSGKDLASKEKPLVSEKEIEEEVFVEEPQEKEEKQEALTSKPSIPYEPIAPFPEALKGGQKYDKNKEIYDVFRKCEVNIPLLDALKQIPRYAKFLKGTMHY